jgi:tetratricopeptide (TPR) repeat protein
MKKDIIQIIIIIFFLGFTLFDCEKRSMQKTAAEIDTAYIDGRNDEIDTSLIRTQANLSFQTGFYSDAVDAYSKLIEIDSSNGMFYFRRAYGMAQLSLYDSAVLDYRRSAKLGYREFHSNLNAGFLYMTILGQDSLAKIHLRRCIELAPDSVRPRDLLKIIEKKNRYVSDHENI